LAEDNFRHCSGERRIKNLAMMSNTTKEIRYTKKFYDKRQIGALPP